MNQHKCFFGFGHKVIKRLWSYLTILLIINIQQKYAVEIESYNHHSEITYLKMHSCSYCTCFVLSLFVPRISLLGFRLVLQARDVQKAFSYYIRVLLLVGTFGSVDF